MPTSRRRVQVTLDPEFERELAAHDPAPSSRSRLIRDMALRGLQAEREAGERAREATDYLGKIASGAVDYDFTEARRAYEERG